MNRIEQAIEREVGTFKKRAYRILVGLYCMRKMIRPSDLVLLIFCAAPPSALDYNPHGRNAQTIVTEWDLTGSKAWIPGLLQSVFYFGFMFGAISFGQLSDYFGRKNVLVKGYAILLIIMFCMGLAQNWQQLLALRVLYGFAVGTSVVEAIIFQEFCGKKLWAFNGVVLGNVAFIVDTLIFIAVAYYIPNWRTLCFISSACGSMAFIYFYIIPESPRWLFSKGKEEEATKVLTKFAKWNSGRCDDYITLANGVPTVENPNNADDEPTRKSALDLIRDPILRRRTIIMGLQWFNASFVYYCIALGSGALSPNFYLAHIISTISTLPGIPLVVVLIEKRWSGRRGTLAACNFLAALSTFLMYILPKEKSSYQLTLLMLGKLGISGAFDIIYIYTPEMYPTVVRNAALGTMSTCARIGGILAPFLANIMVSSNAQTPFLLYGTISGACGVLALLLPETLGKEIPSTMRDVYMQEETAMDNCNSDTETESDELEESLI